ncbi:hypothetical protein CPU12_07860 [Malaciobacter molluscorum LMG 25693]|uniref:NnrS family protein n=1 Tax=Malaciobacter molluscorum LMG 25693 TaxID=870501 RepID=A0A2G1DHL7_9BACT|nr:NnrS family protein [Malaciobacter molluscorum]AXX93349.1 NnrS family protein [Malaciobacter molluscorum LMG 25693]PHO18002.1 hypothetical protein CPU12_07860 [Malaciobacter molluscorum LMG 25693]
MQFSTLPNQPIIEKTWWKRFTSQPHQIFFSAAIFFALIVMTLTLFTFVNIGNFDFSLIHGFGLNFGVFTNAFLGFLITVIPKYTSSNVIPKNRYLYAWVVYQLGVLIALFINTFSGKVLISFTLFYFIKIFFETIKTGKAVNKDDSLYINFILIIGATLLFIEASTSTNLSTLIFFSYLLSMVFIIALKMVPAFFFTFTKVSFKTLPKYTKQISILLLILTGISLQFQLNYLTIIISFISSIFFGFIIFKLNILKQVPAILFILTIGLVWFEIAYICLFLESIFITYSFKLAFHIFALGFVTTLLIGFGSRVCLGHAVPAQPIIVDSFTELLFLLTQIILLLRIMTSIGFILNSNIYTIFLHLSSTLWILLFILWLFKFGKYLLRIKS